MKRVQFKEYAKYSKTLLVQYYILSLFTIFGSCKPEEPYVITCLNGPVKVEYPRFTNLTLQNVGDLTGQPTNLRNLTLIIQTNADYEYYLKSGIPLPNIDFKRKTMLIVRTDERINFQLGPENSNISIDCDKNEIIRRMDALSDEPNVPEYFSHIFVIVIPKITKDKKFYFQRNILK
ncbi:hypothetical protein [Dyadobacter sandarakinus]|uniref:Lipoprotein n=1 Tax=Dyadobacter sandarakinus TaxID=2747268 RepID=A0ABX7I2U7_9BACT|nr:hypothetical protein [Dyadobacter sandarakinus]QRR00149.1 hypothetical protein HWI92_04135 [Dyadobacter sandarakinus]